MKIIQVATWARSERVSELKANAFEKMIRKWDSKEVDRAREARKTVSIKIGDIQLRFPLNLKTVS